MVLKVTVHKQNSKQSLSKVTLDATVRRCSSKICNIKTPVLASLFNKVEEENSTQVFSCEWAYADLLLLFKNTM